MTPRRYTASTLELCAALGIGRKALRTLIAEGWLLPGKHYRQHGTGKVRKHLIWDIDAVGQALDQRTRRLKVGQA